MAYRALGMKGEFDWISVHCDDSLLSAENLGNMIGVLAVVLMIGFVLGYMCSIKVDARSKVMMKIEISQGKTIGTQTKGSPSRTMSTQSQCTYKRKHVTPRFHVLPQMVDGAFIASMSTPIDVD